MTGNATKFRLSNGVQKYMGIGTLIYPAMGITLALLILLLDTGLMLGVFCGTVVLFCSACWLEFGIAALLVSVIVLQQAVMFTASVPFFGGGLKPPDLFLLAILSGWAARKAVFTHGDLRALPQPVSGLLLLFLGWALARCALAFMSGIPYKDALFELRPLLQYLLFFPMVTELRPRGVHRVAWTVVIAASLVSLEGLVLYGLGIGTSLEFSRDSIRVTDIEFAYPLFSLLLSSSLLVSGHPKRMVLLGAVVLSLLGLFVTLFRSAWLGMFFAFLFIWLAHGTGSKTRKIAVAALSLLIASSIWIQTARHVAPLAALEERILSVFKYREDPSAQHRLLEWEAALNTIREHPLIGSGLGYRLRFYSPLYSEEEGTEGFLSDDFYIHNSFVWMGTKMGLIGVGLFVSVLAAVFLRVLAALFSNPSGRDAGMLLGFGAILVAFVVISMFGPMFNLANLTPFFAFLAAGTYLLGSNLEEVDG